MKEGDEKYGKKKKCLNKQTLQEQNLWIKRELYHRVLYHSLSPSPLLTPSVGCCCFLFVNELAASYSQEIDVLPHNVLSYRSKTSGCAMRSSLEVNSQNVFLEHPGDL